MAISAVSSISAGDLVRLFGSPSFGSIGPVGKSPAVLRVEAVPGLASREDARSDDAPPADGAEGAAPAVPGGKEGGRGKAPASARAADPRRPEAILAGRREEGDIRSRLDELLGEKSAMERRQAEQAGRRSAELTSVLAQLRSRDSEVRAHEAAHMAAGGRYVTGGATYSYQRGPDGAQYAVGGEVGIDTSPVPGRPEETAQKMRVICAAALAPSDPSAADLSVAAAASQAEAEALAEIASSRAEELAGRYGQEAAASRAGSGGSPPRSSLDMVA
jgi:hypothetical protein